MDEIQPSAASISDRRLCLVIQSLGYTRTHRQTLEAGFVVDSALA
jgi:hypothetical protein